MLAGLCAATAAHAQGGPPLLTDDPGTPGDGNWEINTAFVTTRTAGAWLLETPLVDLNYGLGPRVQLKYEIPLLVVAGPDAAARVGVGPSLAGVKIRFVDGGEHGVAVSAYPQLGIDTVTKSLRRGLVDTRTSFFLPFQATTTLGPVELDAELGYTWVSGQRGEWTHGLAVGHPISPSVELVAELFGTAGRDFRGEQLVVQAGGRVRLSEVAGLLVAVGRGIAGAAGERPDLLSYVGLQLTL